jgi:hypothetical protein
MNRKVQFLIGGVQKSGTTALFNYLKQHPGIFLPDEKELHYFDTASCKNDYHYNNYHKYYDFSNQNILYGEATPNYIYWNPCVKRIFNYNYNIKWIILFRNPVERAFSQWNMNRLNNWENRGFSDAILCDLEKMTKYPSLKHRRYSYISRGMYYQQSTNLLSYFQRKNILFLKDEDLKFNPVDTMKKVCNFLCLDIIEIQKFELFYSLEYEHSMNQNERKLLLDIYDDEIDNLEKIIGWNCSDWKKI